MKKFNFNIRILLTFFLGNLVFCTSAESQNNMDVVSILSKSILKIDPNQKLQSDNSLILRAIEVTNLLEQSERFEGPWITNHQEYSITSSLKYDGILLRLEKSTIPAGNNLQYGAELEIKYSNSVSVIRQGLEGTNGWTPAQNQFHNKVEFFALSLPHILLSNLKKNSEAKLLSREIYQGRDHIVIGFVEKGGPAKLYIDPNTFLPTAVEYIYPRTTDIFKNIWGDAKSTIKYSFWILRSDGIHYPHQLNESFNEQPYRQINFTNLALSPEYQKKDFQISTSNIQQALKVQFREVDKFLTISDEFTEVVKGIKLFEGAWNTVFVEQENGIFIIEGVISSAFGKATIEKAKHNFLGKPLLGVITTSDAWPHMGGLRPFVANDIPIIHLDANRPIIEKLINASFKTRPDNLEKTPKSPYFSSVSKLIQLGKGQNRLNVFPVRGEGGERMMMVHFPEHKLLYATDLIQLNSDGSIIDGFLSYSLDVVRAVCSNKLEVHTYFTMHHNLKNWDDLISNLNLPPENYCAQVLN